GRFSFAPQPNRDAPSSQKSIGAFLIEAVRLEDETARDELDLPQPASKRASVPKLTPPAIGGPPSNRDDLAPRSTGSPAGSAPAASAAAAIAAAAIAPAANALATSATASSPPVEWRDSDIPEALDPAPRAGVAVPRAGAAPPLPPPPPRAGLKLAP